MADSTELKERLRLLKEIKDLESERQISDSFTNHSFDDLAKTLRNVVEDMSKINNVSRDVNKNYKGLISITDQLAAHTNKLRELDSKKLESLKQQTIGHKDHLKNLKDQLSASEKLYKANEKKYAIELKQLTELRELEKDKNNYVERTLNLLDKEIEKRKEIEKIEQRKQNKSNLLKLILGDNIGGAISNMSTLFSKSGRASLIEKGMKKSGGGYVSGPGTGTSDSIPAVLSNGESVINARSTSMFAPLLSTINSLGGGKKFARGGIAGFAGGGTAGSSSAEAANLSIPKSADLAQKIGGLFGPEGAIIGKAIGETLDMITAELNKIIALAVKYDQTTTDTARTLGVAKDRVRELRKEYIDLADSQKDLLFTGSEMLETVKNVNDENKTSLVFSAKQAAELTKLVKYTGLTNKEAVKLSGTFGETVDNSEKIQNSILKTATNASLQYGVSVNLKSVMKDISNISDGIIVKFKGNKEALVAATVEAKKYGLTLEQADKIGESLLNWETSIQTELKAELLTGRELNVERARAAALTGDQADLMSEIATQVGTLEDFQNLNVLAQRSLAEAFGMSRDELATMLMDQQRVNLLGEIAKKSALDQLNYAKANNIELGESLTKQLQQQSIQERLVRVLENINDKLMGSGLEKVGTAGAEAGFDLQTIKRRAAASAMYGMFGGAQQTQDGIAPPSNGPFTVRDSFGRTSITATGDGLAVSPNINRTNNSSTNNDAMLARIDRLISVTQQGRVSVWNDQIVARENLRSTNMNNPIYFS
jgi:hypothetical protein